MHYLDEGEGVAVLMLHGNPTWSYLYRDVIKSLNGECRCIAPDYPGFGYSEHPSDYDYTPKSHADWIESLIEYLDLQSLIMVVQDWGGPIGLSVAVRQPQRIAGLVICNTWCWPAPVNAWMFSFIMGGILGKYLHLRRNFFARRIVPWGILKPERKTPENLRAYTEAFPTPQSRMGTWVFPREIRKSKRWLKSIEEKLGSLRHGPVELVWAMKDPAFGKESYIRRWLQHFSHAQVERIKDASHYVQEDRPDRVAAGVKRLLK